ncbi:MAG: hypothetical protein PVH19_06750 [Planctomycetia bacterium]
MSAKDRLDQAVQNIERCNAIQGEITYLTNLLGHQINGKGTYAELRSRRIPYFRLELKIPLDDKMGILAKVCDGRYLWSYCKVLDHEELEQIDMDRVQEALEEKQGNQPGSRFPNTPSAFAAIGEGGIANMLRQLKKNFLFDTPTESKLDRMPILRLEGTWSRRNLTKFLPDQKEDIKQGKTPDLSKLPAHIPDRVVISLGRQNLFPYRIEYLRTDRAKSKNSAAGQGGESLMTIYFHNVQFTPEINESYFDYRPGELEPVDKTHDYIKRLK